MIPVAPPAAAATATTPLPPPYVAVDMESPIKDHVPTPRHFGFAPPPPAGAASAAGSILVSPTKPSAAAASVAAHTPVPPCATNDLEGGQTPFRLWCVCGRVVAAGYAYTLSHKFTSNATHTSERVVIFTAAYHVCDGVSLTIRKLRAHLQAKGIESRVVSSGPEGEHGCVAFIMGRETPGQPLTTTSNAPQGGASPACSPCRASPCP